MAEKPEVIQQELEETRHALAEKLEQIGTKISGTVDTVSDTVNSVSETVSNVTEAVEGTVQAVAESVSGTVESVKDTVEAVGEKASETVEAVKDAFNLPDQIRRRPWLWVGGSVAVGFALGKIFGPRRQHHTPEAWEFVRGGGYHEEMEPPAETRQTNGRHTGETTTNEPESHSGVTSMLGNITQHFGPELNKLKELALGTLFGVTRDVIAKTVPESLHDQVTHLFDDVTEKAGGKPIQGTVFEESEQQSNPAEGEEHGQPNPTEMDRSMGAADRKGKAAVGQSDRR